MAGGQPVIAARTERPAGYPGGVLGPVARACLRHPPCPVVIVALNAWQPVTAPAPRSAEEAAASVT